MKSWGIIKELEYIKNQMLTNLVLKKCYVF